ncbi:YncE family protein [Mucilaginibacter terrae]|uniref:YncE family protein n=1 Tax=Mucilaginibacter terrae TaxID=1955052 RepID=UPI003639CF15
MKTTLRCSSKTTLLVFASCLLLFSSCKKDNDEIEAIDPEIESTAGVYMLSEGSFGSGNSEITYYDIKSGVTQRNYYKKVNGTDLGENATDLQRHGSKMYCVVSGKTKGQSFVDVMNVFTGKTLKRISFNSANDAYFPRSVTFYQNKAYVSCYDGSIRRIDTASLAIDGEVKLATYQEGLAVANGKLYVAQSDYTFTGKNTVSVVDLATFAKTKDITVTINPVKVAAATNGDIYVISYGNYSNIAGNLDRINSVTDAKVTATPVAGVDYNSSISITGSAAYMSVTDAATFSSIIKPLNVSNGTLGNSLVTDNATIGILYGLTIDPFSKEVYVADALSYTSTTGKAYCFGTNGKKKFEFETGQNPQHAVFIYNYKKQ